MKDRSKKLQTLERRLPEIMCKDYPAIRGELNRLKRLASGDTAFENRLRALMARIDASVEHAAARAGRLPDITSPDELPITARRDEIIQTIRDHQVVIISGETGSGKTTQIPKFCLAAGRGARGIIGCTQPRRIAAITVAQRIAEEMQQPLGQAVGYKIRFRDTVNTEAYIKIMTDGILLAEAQTDRFLNAYDTLIIDEAHERSLNIDFCLGILKMRLQRRRNLKVVITSATIDTEKFSAAFNNAPIIEVSGRLYPVAVRYEDATADADEEGGHIEQAVAAVGSLFRERHGGDILVFMPTEQDIRDTCELLEGRYGDQAQIMPLYARLSARDQGRIFRPSKKRKIVVATNVAETSITIPGIRYVVDSGLARISRYSPRSRTTALPVAPVSRSSADQRMGRCGRLENGICVRLYSEADYEDRPLFTLPEILRANLADVILRMLALRLGDIDRFPFVDPPAPRSIQDGYDLLLELDAVRIAAGRRKSGRYQLTQKGRLMARIPLDPRLSAMLIAAHRLKCLGEMAVIAAALSIQDPRERPAEKAAEADKAHAVFDDPASDFMALLNIWRAYQDAVKKMKSGNRLRRYCREQYLSARRMREWVDIHGQVAGILEEHGMRPDAFRDETAGNKKDAKFDARYTAIHQSILSGYLSNIAVKKEQNWYRATKGRDVMIFPGSGVFNKGPAWIMAAEIVETSRLFARTVAAVDVAWIEPLGGDRCRRTYLDPHWERNRGEVVASEQVSLFGLIIVSGRKVSYGRIDPDAASDIFIRSALVAGDVKNPLPFMTANQEKISAVCDMEDRVRRRDLMVSPEDIHEFYTHRLEKVHDIRTLKQLIRKRGGDGFLRMRTSDLLRRDPDLDELACYPEQIDLGTHRFECEYRFSPGKSDDGITVKVPVSKAFEVPPDAVDWLVPGLYREKVTALIKSLPKEYRKRLVPIAETVDIVVKEMPVRKGNLQAALGLFIYRRFGVDIPAAAWAEATLPDHLKMRITLTDHAGEAIASSRDKHILRQSAAPEAGNGIPASLRQEWEQDGLTPENFPDLPDRIPAVSGGVGDIPVYPGLCVVDAGVSLRLFQHAGEAADAHPKGVEQLYRVYFSKDLKFLKRHLTVPPRFAGAAALFGGAKTVAARLFDRACHDLFARNIRTRDQFQAHADAVKPVLLNRGGELLDAVMPVLEACAKARAAIDALTSGPAPPVLQDFAARMRHDLDQLAPKTFITLYELERMSALVRYISAITIRTERARINFDKEHTKAAAVAPYEKQAAELVASLTPHTSAEKRTALEAFFWMLQEFKVSVFAQELGTAMPVSRKRLDEKLSEIRRML